MLLTNIQKVGCYMAWNDDAIFITIIITAIYYYYLTPHSENKWKKDLSTTMGCGQSNVPTAVVNQAYTPVFCSILFCPCCLLCHLFIFFDVSQGLCTILR